MSGPFSQRPDGRWERLQPQPESFGVTWERCWRNQRRHGRSLMVALVYGWLDARDFRRMRRAERP